MVPGKRRGSLKLKLYTVTIVVRGVNLFIEKTQAKDKHNAVRNIKSRLRKRIGDAYPNFPIFFEEDSIGVQEIPMGLPRRPPLPPGCKRVLIRGEEIIVAK